MNPVEQLEDATTILEIALKSHDKSEQIRNLTVLVEALAKQLNEAKRSAEFNFDQYQDAGRELLKACEQRDELLAALEAVKEQAIDGHVFPAVVNPGAWWQRVIYAIASVKGGAA